VFLRASNAIFNSKALILQLSHHCRLALDRWQGLIQREHTQERVLERRAPIHDLVQWTERTQKVQTVAMRLQQQYRRVENDIPPEGADRPTSEGAASLGERRRDVVHYHWVHRVEMVLKRDVPKDEIAHQASGAASNAAWHRTRLATERPVVEPYSASVNWTSAEVQRLTDQVLTKLDHRVIAARERLGRL
jgi:hypothetical protein